MTTRWIETNGVQLRYDLTPGPSGTIVLVHEMGGAIESWDEIVTSLSARASVLRFDQRCAGLSEKVPGALRVEHSADDLAGLIDALSIEPPIAVVGAAVGGAVAAAFAARHPGKLKALALLAPSTVITEDRRPAALQRIETIERDGVRVADAAEPAAARSRYEIIRMSADPHGLGATWRMLVHMDLQKELASISCPTLVVAGSKDTARPPDHVATVAARIPGATFRVLETGHVMAIDSPALVAETILAFFDECGF